jgi:hypothetical protein
MSVTSCVLCRDESLHQGFISLSIAADTLAVCKYCYSHLAMINVKRGFEEEEEDSNRVKRVPLSLPDEHPVSKALKRLRDIHTLAIQQLRALRVANDTRAVAARQYALWLANKIIFGSRTPLPLEAVASGSADYDDDAGVAGSMLAFWLAWLRVVNTLTRYIDELRYMTAEEAAAFKPTMHAKKVDGAVSLLTTFIAQAERELVVQHARLAPLRGGGYETLLADPTSRLSTLHRDIVRNTLAPMALAPGTIGTLVCPPGSKWTRVGRASVHAGATIGRATITLQEGVSIAAGTGGLVYVCYGLADWPFPTLLRADTWRLKQDANDDSNIHESLFDVECSAFGPRWSDIQALLGREELVHPIWGNPVAVAALVVDPVTGFLLRVHHAFVCGIAPDGRLAYVVRASAVGAAAFYAAAIDWDGHLVLADNRNMAVRLSPATGTHVSTESLDYPVGFEVRNCALVVDHSARRLRLYKLEYANNAVAVDAAGTVVEFQTRSAHVIKLEAVVEETERAALLPSTTTYVPFTAIVEGEPHRRVISYNDGPASYMNKSPAAGVVTSYGELVVVESEYERLHISKIAFQAS